MSKGQPRSASPLRPAWLQLVALGAAVTVVLELVRPAAHVSPTLSATAETAMMLFALGTATWMGITFAHTRHLRTLLLVGGVVTLAATQLVADGVPAILHHHSANAFTAGLSLGELVAAALFAASAMTVSDRLLTSRGRPLALVLGGSFVAAVIAELVGLAAQGVLLADAPGRRPAIGEAAHRPFGVLVILLTIGLLGYAGGQYARKARGEEGSARSLVAAALMLLAGAYLYQLVVPSSSPDTVSAGTLLQLLGFVCFFAAAMSGDLEIRSHLTRAATIAERSRVAQDLHDGLAQDLALIAVHAGRLATDLGEDHPLSVAARHALSLSRGTIGELSDTTSVSVREALEAVATELGLRFGIAIAVDVQDAGELQPQVRETVSRIAREAIANAARHGRARNVVLSLKRSAEGMILRVCDDGLGFGGASASTSSGFGLTHMYERAALLGGSLSVRARRSGGTELELLFN